MAKHTWIAEELRQDIRRGVFSTGAMLPGRRELARRFSVAVPTLERAVRTLISEGWLRADDRRGTFVERRTPASNPNPGHPILGVITTLHRSDEGAETNRAWTDGISSGLEAEVNGGGGRTVFVNRWRGVEGLLPLAEAVEHVRASGAEAIALVADGDPPEQTLKVLGNAGLPFVLVSAVDIHHPAPAVVFDGFSAGYQATQHLIEADCRNLVMLLPFDADWVHERVAGARRAIAELGAGRVRLDLYPRKLPSFVELAAEGPLIYQDPGRAAGEALLPRRRPRVRIGYIAINDAMAFGFLEVAAQRGLRPGKDFLLIGFDDLPDARHAGLSSFRVPLEQMGREAGRLLLQAIRKDRNLSQVKVLATLLPRASSAGPKAGSGAVNAEPADDPP